MGPSKSPTSQVETLAGLCASLVGTDPLGITSARSLQRDLASFESRVRCEGLPYLTRALPALAKALDQALVTNVFCVPNGFKRAHKGCSIPAFMQTYFKAVVNDDGTIRDDANVGAIAHLRQVLYFVYKYEVPYTEELTGKVVDSFVNNERDLELNGETYEHPLVSGASYIIRDVLEGFDPKDVVPKHGPGSVATGEKGEEKWQFSRKYRQIHRVYPYYTYFVAGGGREVLDRLDWYRSLRPEESGVAKVVLVPKDSRGPRLISCEPLEYQYIQQGLSRSLTGWLERHRLTRERVNFSSQEFNRQLALVGSKTGEWATLDLKDASDLVSMALVRKLFQHNEQVLECIGAVRSSATVLPDGRRVVLAKHAPMGSAMCFPIMALSCWAIIVSAVARATRTSAVSVGRLVYIFGDDIVVPTEWAQVSMQALELCGLRVNRDKSCISGGFRESCGLDAFRGVEVTPTRLKTVWSGKRSDGKALESYASIANNLFAKGYTRTASLIRDMLVRTYGPLPYGTRQSAYPCIWVDDAWEATVRNTGLFRTRYSQEYQRLEFRVNVTVRGYGTSELDGWNRLLRFETTGVGDYPDRVDSLVSTKVRQGWQAVF